MTITNGLITLEDAKASLGLAQSVTQYDADLESYVEAATPLVEAVVGPQYARSQTYKFDGGGHTITLPVRFNTVTSITVDSVAITDWVAEATAGIIHSGLSTSPTDFNSGTQNVVVIVTVGSATIASNIQLATRELVRHFWQVGRQANRPGVAEVIAGENSKELPYRVQKLLAASPGLAGFA